jgi:hypothetical protein
MSSTKTEIILDPEFFDELRRYRETIDTVLETYAAFSASLAKLPPELARRLSAKLLGDTAPHVKKATTPIARGRAKPGAKTPSTAQQTHYDRIVKYLRSDANKPKSSAEIRQATGLQRGTISLILYKSHKDSFTQTAHPTKFNRVLWNLKDAP